MSYEYFNYAFSERCTYKCISRYNLMIRKVRLSHYAKRINFFQLNEYEYHIPYQMHPKDKPWEKEQELSKNAFYFTHVTYHINHLQTNRYKDVKSFFQKV